MTLILLVAPGPPVSGKNHKDGFVIPGPYGPRAIVTQGKAIRAWYKRVVPALVDQFAGYGLPTITSPVHVEVHSFAARALFDRQTPDGDNVQAAAWDALVRAKILADDRLVVTWGGSKQQDAARPRTEIEVRVLDRRERAERGC